MANVLRSLGLPQVLLQLIHTSHLAHRLHHLPAQAPVTFLMPTSMVLDRSSPVRPGWREMLSVTHMLAITSRHINLTILTLPIRTLPTLAVVVRRMTTTAMETVPVLATSPVTVHVQSLRSGISLTSQRRELVTELSVRWLVVSSQMNLERVVSYLHSQVPSLVVLVPTLMKTVTGKITAWMQFGRHSINLWILTGPRARVAGPASTTISTMIATTIATADATMTATVVATTTAVMVASVTLVKTATTLAKNNDYLRPTLSGLYQLGSSHCETGSITNDAPLSYIFPY